MSATVTLPVHLRVGNGAECEVGTVTLDLVAHHALPTLHESAVRSALAEFLRAAANELDQGVTDASA